jgi:hypothetical protein
VEHGEAPEVATGEMKKVCFRCGKWKVLGQFYRHMRMADGHLNKCIDCTKVDVAKHRVNNPDKLHQYDRERYSNPERKARCARSSSASRRRYPERTNARTKVARAVKSGRLVRQPCEVCGAKANAHHEDYSKPLEVRWLCSKHHGEHHRKPAA